MSDASDESEDIGYLVADESGGDESDASSSPADESPHHNALLDLEASESDGDDDGDDDSGGSDEENSDGERGFHHGFENEYPEFHHKKIHSFPYDNENEEKVQMWESAHLENQTAPVRALMAVNTESRTRVLQTLPDRLHFRGGRTSIRFNKEKDMIALIPHRILEGPDDAEDDLSQSYCWPDLERHRDYAEETIHKNMRKEMLFFALHPSYFRSGRGYLDEGDQGDQGGDADPLLEQFTYWPMIRACGRQEVALLNDGIDFDAYEDELSEDEPNEYESEGIDDSDIDSDSNDGDGDDDLVVVDDDSSNQGSENDDDDDGGVSTFAGFSPIRRGGTIDLTNSDSEEEGESSALRARMKPVDLVMNMALDSEDPDSEEEEDDDEEEMKRICAGFIVSTSEDSDSEDDEEEASPPRAIVKRSRRVIANSSSEDEDELPRKRRNLIVLSDNDSEQDDTMKGPRSQESAKRGPHRRARQTIIDDTDDEDGDDRDVQPKIAGSYRSAIPVSEDEEEDSDEDENPIPISDEENSDVEEISADDYNAENYSSFPDDEGNEPMDDESGDGDQFFEGQADEDVYEENDYDGGF
ncbi:hypothetical protein B0T24DRAFT_694265 [Lasiosphaeria ovina]|uniref:Uncharacterized protein n=1 Tax=Lasiosphaeria ovina TaxID=92902 RepID=A0AAE0NCK0_9PEZI|nr:hypothetical protein B0T24DRAFT_694265 [Lasiosphaeria ovina]